MKPEQKALIKNFLHQHQLGVISTVDPNGNPESAVVGFGETPELQLTFGTSINSRKVENMITNPNVAFVVGWDENITVQYEGTARLLEVDEAKKYQELYAQKVPGSRKFRDDPTNRYYLVTPTWIRYSDLNQKPWQIFELKF